MFCFTSWDLNLFVKSLKSIAAEKVKNQRPRIESFPFLIKSIKVVGRSQFTISAMPFVIQAVSILIKHRYNQGFNSFFYSFLLQFAYSDDKLNNFTAPEEKLISTLNFLLCQDSAHHGKSVKLPLSTLQLFVTSLSCYYERCAESSAFCSIVRDRQDRKIFFFFACEVC